MKYIITAERRSCGEIIQIWGVTASGSFYHVKGTKGFIESYRTIDDAINDAEALGLPVENEIASDLWHALSILNI